MTNKIIIIALTGAFSLLVTGCAELSWQSPFDVGAPTAGANTRAYSVSDPDDIDVLETPNSESLRVLSVVTGDSCQTRFDQPPASREQALSFLREDAARFGADAIIQLQCYQLPPTADSRCYTQVSCFAKAAAYNQ